jgi:hypothetical protein
MSWTYVSDKDGTTMTDIPDDVKLGDQRFLDELAKVRASKSSGQQAQAPSEQSQNPLDAKIPLPNPLTATKEYQSAVGNLTPEELAQVRKMVPNFDDSSTTLAGLGGAVARGNPITGMTGMLGDLADPLVKWMSGGKIGAGMNPNDMTPPSQQIQDYLTSLGVQNADTEAEKFTQLLSGFIPMGGGVKAPTGAVTPAEQAVMDAKSVGGKLMTSDVFPPKGGMGQFTQTIMEKNPFLGTGNLRVAQQKDRVEAIRDLLNQYGANDLNQTTDAVMTDLLQKRGADLARLTGQKNEVIDRLSRSVEPDGPIPFVPVSNTVEAIDGQIAKLKSLNTDEVKPVIAKLEDWKKAVQGQPLENVELLRRQFGESFNDPGLAGVKNTAQKSLNEIYPAVNKDMGEFIKATGKPEDYAQWKSANTELAGSIKEMEVVALKNALDNGGQTPEAVQRLLFSAKPSDVQLLYKNLTPEGRGQAQAAVLAKVAKDALSAGTDIISPEKFVAQVQKQGGPIGVLFSGADKERLDGLVRYLNTTRQASKFAANPQTGQQAIVPMVGMGSIGGLANTLGAGAPSIESALLGVAGTVAGGSLVGGASRFYESPVVRDLLVKLAKAKEKDEAATIVKNITTALVSTAENAKSTSASDKARAYQSSKPQGAQQ